MQNRLRDEAIKAATYGGDHDARRRVYLAGCLAKMQRSGPCSRDFDLDCAEPITDEHIRWANAVLGSLARLDVG